MVHRRDIRSQSGERIAALAVRDGARLLLLNLANSAMPGVAAVFAEPRQRLRNALQRQERRIVSAPAVSIWML